MLTRCPYCETTFRVTAEQLKARRGQVRCGACRGVFDALESLVEEVPVVVPPLPAASASAEMPAVSEEPAPPTESIAVEELAAEEIAAEAAAAEEVVIEEPTVEVLPDVSEEAAEPEEPAPSAPAPDSAAAPEPVAEAEAQESAVAAAEAPLPPAWEAVSPPPSPPRRWPWAVGAALLFFLALGQLVFIFRTEIAASSPELRPMLAAGCELFGCTVPRPRRPELLSIETSDLAPEGAGLLLTATLKNRAPFAQDYPALELTLTDTQDQALVRKVLMPADWLPAGRAGSAGFAAQGEVAVKLLFAADGVPAVGYRLYLFYP